MKANGNANWTPADAAELYGIRNWGAGYFDLADDGAVTVNVTSDGQRVSVSIPDIIAGMQQRGLQMPVLLRIENLLDSQITLLNETFARAIANLGYRACYRGVFPIKVNQQCQVIEEIARFGASYGHGLEAGSKAELLIAYMAAGFGMIGKDASHLVQATAIVTFVASSYVVVLNCPNPIAISDRLRRD